MGAEVQEVRTHAARNGEDEAPAVEEGRGDTRVRQTARRETGAANHAGQPPRGAAGEEESGAHSAE